MSQTFSIAIFCAALAMSFGTEIVVFSKLHVPPPHSASERRVCLAGPARRASRKLLECAARARDHVASLQLTPRVSLRRRMVEFIRLLYAAQHPAHGGAHPRSLRACSLLGMATT